MVFIIKRTYKFLLIVILIFAGVNLKSFAAVSKFDSEVNHNIRISTKLSNFDIGVKDVEYTLIKYEDSSYKKAISTYKFMPTILKTVSLSSNNKDWENYYYAISPDVYEATAGYYDIYQNPKDSYYNPGKIRFSINNQGFFEEINTNNYEQNYEVDTGIYFEKNASCYDKKGQVTKQIKNKKTYHYKFKINTENQMVLHTKASTYSEIEPIPDSQSYHDLKNTAYFDLYMLNEETNKWINIPYPYNDTNLDKKIINSFPVEIEKYGGGIRIDFNQQKPYFYKYNFNIGLTPNSTYRFIQKYAPPNYVKNKKGDYVPKFSFTIHTSSTSKIISAKMDKLTYNYYGNIYNNFFDKKNKSSPNDIFIENTTANDLSSGLISDRNLNISKLYILNIEAF